MWCQANDHTGFFKELPIITEITLTLMTWKAKSDMTHCEYLCPVRSVALSFNCWSTTRGFPGRDPRNSSWTICILLCPQTSIIWEESIIVLVIPDPERSPFVHIRIVCLCRIRLICTPLIVRASRWPRKHWYRVKIYLYWVWNIDTGSEIIRLS